MSFPRYPAYKDSGVEWLGEVPEHWEILAIKRLASLQSGTGITSDSILDDGPYPVFGGNGVRGFSESFTHDGNYPIIGRQGALCGNINYASGRFWASEHAVVASPANQCEFRWLGEMLRAMNLNQYSTSAAQPGLSVEMVSALLAARPPRDEQLAIATFLDRETAKIDALIAEQQRLIALLQEKRQAVISHAVTKGLNPEAPMKDSGVEWLGEVPEHWETGPLSYALSAIGDADHYMPPAVADGVPYVMTGDLEDLASEIDFTGCKQISRHDYDQLCKKIKTSKGDLIVARYATIGTVSYVDLDFEFIVSYSCVTIRPKMEKVLGRFLFFCLKSDSFFQGIQGRVNTNTQGNVGIGDLRKLKVVLPPVEEQLEIVEFLQLKSEEMGGVIESSEEVIRLLKERRSALISAAVTGQIDVRGLVPEASAV
jgi:type I restriction enzyme S subunit